jgi:hypothetical protein
MSDSKFPVQEFLSQPTRWDQLIAADLSGEIQAMLAEKVDTIPEMRRFLAILEPLDYDETYGIAVDVYIRTI